MKSKNAMFHTWENFVVSISAAPRVFHPKYSAGWGRSIQIFDEIMLDGFGSKLVFCMIYVKYRSFRVETKERVLTSITNRK